MYRYFALNGIYDVKTETEINIVLTHFRISYYFRIMYIKCGHYSEHGFLKYKKN